MPKLHHRRPWLRRAMAILLISHDRQFMDEIIQTVYEINERKLVQYTGNYTDFLQQKEERYEQQNAAYKNQQKEIADLQAFADRFRAIPSKAGSQSPADYRA